MPRYDFACDSCKIVQERTIAVADIPNQRCGLGHRMRQSIDFRSISFACYAQDSIYTSEFTGPRQRARYLKDRGLVDAGGSSASALAEAKRHHERLRRDAEDKQDREVKKAVLDALDTVGDADLFTRDPKTLPAAPPAGDGPGAAWTGGLPA